MAKTKKVEEKEILKSPLRDAEQQPIKSCIVNFGDGKTALVKFVDDEFTIERLGGE